MVNELEQLEVYQIAETIADQIWLVVLVWGKFERDTIGKQLVRSADSISANISEGHGRFAFKENIQFCYYARGSLMETKNWLRRTIHRKLITPEQYAKFEEQLEILGKKLNAYITSMKKQIK